MAQKIAVIDYGMGNLHSVSKAVEHVADAADEIKVTDNPDYIHQADRIVFPGQGAARDCMAAISDHHLNQAVLEASRSKPFLGICMGMQVLMQHSEENAGTELMGLYPGKVIRFPESDLKVPHMGWNNVNPTHDHPLWQGIASGSRFYFVHSYYVQPEQPALAAATTDYGIDFTCAITQNNVFAVQFHPEKSAAMGLQLLKNFIAWQPE